MIALIDTVFGMRQSDKQAPDGEWTDAKKIRKQKHIGPLGRDRRHSLWSLRKELTKLP